MKLVNHAGARCLALVAWLGATGVARAIYDPYQLPDPSRRWSVNVSLREGYDDNVFTTANNKRDSLTTAVEPQLLVNVPLEQTFFGLRYTYGATYYVNRPGDEIDQSHSADLLFSHTFSTRLTLDMQDSIRRGLSPELVEIHSGVPLITRQRGNYLYNNLGGTLSYALHRRWTLTISGTWLRWRYDDPGNAFVNDQDSYRTTVGAVYAIDPLTSVGISYQYGKVDYANPATSAVRNSDSNSGFLTFVRRFNPKLSLRVSGGMELREFVDHTTQTSPSASSSISYNYAPESAVSVGFYYQIQTTEVGTYRSTDSASLYGSINHRITPKLRASGSVAYSISTYQNPTPGSGAIPGLEEDSFRIGLGLTYSFERWLSGDLGYTYDQVQSDFASREFTRNQVTLGVRFIY